MHADIPERVSPGSPGPSRPEGSRHRQTPPACAGRRWPRDGAALLGHKRLPRKKPGAPAQGVLCLSGLHEQAGYAQIRIRNRPSVTLLWIVSCRKKTQGAQRNCLFCVLCVLSRPSYKNLFPVHTAIAVLLVFLVDAATITRYYYRHDRSKRPYLIHAGISRNWCRDSLS